MTIKFMLCICCNCKCLLGLKPTTEAGKALDSHGICNSCAKKLYPNLVI